MDKHEHQRKPGCDAFRLGLCLVFFLAAWKVSAIPLSSEAAAIAAEPSVTISPSPVAYKRKSKVTISGAGFQPKQELNLRIMMGGVMSDISFLVKPRPVTNDKGEFASVWTLNREASPRLLSPTSHTIEVVDEDGKTLAKGTLVFKKPAKKKK